MGCVVTIPMVMLHVVGVLVVVGLELVVVTRGGILIFLLFLGIENEEGQIGHDSHFQDC
jgi:hypothetical protein